MNKQETLALWAQGKEAWNAWAEDMLDRRAAMEREGTWAASRNLSGFEVSGSEATADWITAAKTDFSGHLFQTAFNVKGILFPGSADFRKAAFQRDAHFNSATFGGDAWFDGAAFGGDMGFRSATFGGDARFRSATFSGYAGFASATFNGFVEFGSATFGGDAGFASATFSGDVWFGLATFSGSAAFVQSCFKGYTSFAGAVFRTKANFVAVQGERSFTLEGARFAEVPDFIQAHFAEAPRLDNVRVYPGSSDTDRSARYRALKRLAIDGHDHAREQEYFAGELKSLRGCPDRLLPNPLNWFRRYEDGNRQPAWPGGARYWFGLGYQFLSDFGRSMLWPLGWWSLALVGFALDYLAQHFSRAGYAGSLGGWLWASIALPLIEWFPSLAEWLPMPNAVASPACLVGPGEPGSAALGLSIRKGLPFAGIASAEKLNQIYACLYGIHGQTPATRELPERFTPVIPDCVDYHGMVQLVLSLLLLFLFLLAVRSHFRIR